MTAFELAGKLKLDAGEFESSLNQQESSFKSFGERLTGVAKTVGKAAAASLATVGAGTVMFVKSSVQEGLQFDAAMAQVAATMGKSVDEVAELSAFARKMGAQTAFSATEAAEALNYMALAGYDANTSMKMLPTVLDLAAAGNFDLARASDMVTDAQSALGLSLDETSTLIGQMARTSSKTNTSVEQLGDAILTVGGTAKNLKGGTTELAAVLGVLADNGIKGSEGGTALRNVLLSLTAPTDKAAKAMAALGIEVFDSEGNMKDFPAILQDINEATKDMTQAERTEFLSTVFNKRDLKSIEALLGTDMARWEQLYSEIGSADGAAGQMAQTQLDNLAGDLKIFQSALSEAKISVSEKLVPALRSLVQKGTGYVTRLTNAFNSGGLKGAISEVKNILWELITGYLDLDTDAGWTDVGMAIWGKIKGGIQTAAGSAKVNVANLLGLTDASGNAINDTSDVSWTSIAIAALGKLRAAFLIASGAAKVRIANLLGLTDEAGNAVNDPSDTSWSAIAGAIFNKIKEGFKIAVSAGKISLANWLGLTDESGNALELGDDVSWESIAEAMKGKLKAAFVRLKIGIADLLNISPENVDGEVSWADIGKEIIDKMTSYFSSGGSFLKKLILGDSYTEKSTWTDVANTVAGWIGAAFSDGGLISVLLGNVTERAAAIAAFAGEVMANFAGWVASNPDSVVSIITSLMNAITRAAPAIISAISTILKDPKLWTAVGDLIKGIWQMVFGTPEDNLNNNLFGGFTGENAGAFAQMQEYIDAYNEMQGIINKLNEVQPGSEEAKNLEAEYDAAYEKVMALYDIVSKLNDPNGKNILSSYMTWMYEHGGYNDDGTLPDIPVELLPNDTEIEEEVGQGYDATVRLHYDDSEDPYRTPDKSPTLPGHNAKGMYDVPYDDYLTRLHRGEMVLSASQARRYKDGGSGVDLSALVSGVISAVRDGMDGAQVNSYMDSGAVNRHVNSVTGKTLMSRRFA